MGKIKNSRQVLRLYKSLCKECKAKLMVLGTNAVEEVEEDLEKDD